MDGCHDTSCVTPSPSSPGINSPDTIALSPVKALTSWMPIIFLLFSAAHHASCSLATATRFLTFPAYVFPFQPLYSFCVSTTTTSLPQFDFPVNIHSSRSVNTSDLPGSIRSFLLFILILLPLLQYLSWWIIVIVKFVCLCVYLLPIPMRLLTLEVNSGVLLN